MTLLTAKPIQTLTSLSVDDLFSLMIQHHFRRTQIVMKLFIPTVNTKDIPWTYSLLQKHLPAILQSICFNEEKLPFSQEVRQTEIGHLFEHILLEYLCQEKLLSGCDEAMFSGRTSWNWERDPWGMFHISIKMHAADTDIFTPALEKSIALLKLIISNSTRDTYPYTPFSTGENRSAAPRITVE
jgi:hypothetical protein